MPSDRALDGVALLIGVPLLLEPEPRTAEPDATVDPEALFAWATGGGDTLGVTGPPRQGRRHHPRHLLALVATDTGEGAHLATTPGVDRRRRLVPPRRTRRGPHGVPRGERRMLRLGPARTGGRPHRIPGHRDGPSLNRVRRHTAGAFTPEEVACGS